MKVDIMEKGIGEDIYWLAMFTAIVINGYFMQSSAALYTACRGMQRQVIPGCIKCRYHYHCQYFLERNVQRYFAPGAYSAKASTITLTLK